MNVYSDGDSYLARLSPDERSAILWAVEVARPACSTTEG